MARWARRLAGGLRGLHWMALRGVAIASSQAASARLAIGAIVKDEEPYLLEWIAWHRCLGIEDFFIADNASRDGTTALLAALHTEGIVTHIPFPGQPGVPPQLGAYRHIAETFRDRTDWIAFIDADEFLRVESPQGDPAGRLQAWLGRLPRRVGAVTVNWAAYGSDGRIEPGEGLVTERFTRRAQKAFRDNDHVKSIVRSAFWQGILETPHGFAITKGALSVDTRAWPVPPHQVRAGRVRRIVWGVARLDHYAVKSRHEFLHRKLKRGRSDTLDPAHSRDEAYFRLYDRNDVFDPPHPRFLARVRAEVARLDGLLSQHGGTGQFAQAAPVQAGAKASDTPFMQ